LPYDYIDDDLDFDEFEYAKMCEHLNRWLYALLVDMAIDNPTLILTSTQQRMEFRNVPPKPIQETTFTFDPSIDASTVKINHTYWEKVI
jgi:hypothetical protein